MNTTPKIFELDVVNKPVLTGLEMRKMVFVMNALENGWSVKKRGDHYIFKKKHEGKREVWRKDYLERFILQNVANT